MIRGIHHIAINTADLDRLRDFYVDVIGFEPAVPEHSWADSPASDAAVGLSGSAARQQMLKAGNCYLEIFEYARPEPRPGEPHRACDRGYTHFALDVTDIEAEYDRLAAAGMEFAHERPLDFGDIKAVYGKDPDGNIIEIQQTTREQAFALAKLGTVSFA
jgi:glyoxylase I family protein